MLLRVAKHSITLTRYNYYNFLKLPQKAPPSQIQAAYFVSFLFLDYYFSDDILGAS